MAKYDSKTIDGKCIFCDIATGKITPLGNGAFWDNEKYMAWLSPFPNTEGFAVVIPKKHYSSDVLAMTDEELSEFVIEAKKVSKLLMKQYTDVGRVGLIMEGMGIDHAHIKLFPMHGTDYLKNGEWKQIASGKNDFYEKYPGYIISTDGPKADFERLSKTADELKRLNL